MIDPQAAAVAAHAAAVPAHGVPGAAVPEGRCGGARGRLTVALAEAHVAEAAAGSAQCLCGVYVHV